MTITGRYAATIIGASRPTGGTSNSPNQGLLIWHTPAGRSYATAPTPYPL